MIRNNIEVDVKVKCIENETTQAQLAETIGTTGQYVNRIIKKKDGVVNKTFVQMLEALGYDIELTYVKREVFEKKERKISSIHAAEKLHQLFERLPVYNWQTIGDIPFQDGIYIVYEKGETYRGHDRIVRVGTHTSQGRLKKRLMDHFVRENHNQSIFRKHIGKAMLNCDRDPYLAIWSLNTSEALNVGKEDKSKEKNIENRVSEYMRTNFTFRVFPLSVKAERLRMEKAIIAALNQTADFKAGRDWLGNSSPEQKICKSGMWVEQGLDAEPLTDTEMLRLSQLISAGKE